jgi:hypothetical protein
MALAGLQTDSRRIECLDRRGTGHQPVRDAHDHHARPWGVLVVVDVHVPLSLTIARLPFIHTRDSNSLSPSSGSTCRRVREIASLPASR